MRHLCAAIAAWMLFLVSVPAFAVTPWNTDAAFPASLDIGTTVAHQIEPGESVFWRPEDTAASPLVVVTGSGAIVVWDDGPATENLTIEQATGDTTTNGAWKTYGPALIATGDCTTRVIAESHERKGKKKRGGLRLLPE